MTKAFQFAQYNFTRVQYHHPTKRADGTSVPLTACLNKGKRKECKHGFPMTKKCSVRSKFICKGVAKQHDTPLTGRRGALGMVLGRRDDEWHTGTACGLSIAFLWRVTP